VQKTLQFKVLISKDSALDVWVARGVNYDIVAQAKRLDDLPDAFMLAVSAQAMADAKNNREPFEGCPPAPSDVAAMFERTRQSLKSLNDAKPQGFPMPQAYQVAAELAEMRICA